MSDITFGTLDKNGKLSNVRILGADKIRACPTFIFWPTHYRADGSCRHDEVICEEDGCKNKKFKPEIFCKKHLGE